MKENGKIILYGESIRIIINSITILIAVLFLYNVFIYTIITYFDINNDTVNRGISLALSLLIIKLYYLINNKIIKKKQKSGDYNLKRLPIWQFFSHMIVNFLVIAIIISFLLKKTLLFYSRIFLTGEITELDLISSMLIAAYLFGKEFTSRMEIAGR